ncbi:MAG: FkbM family methyltransferase, partial [Acidobacteriota bacterium]
LVERWRELSSAPLYNLYGPTETTIWSTAQRLDPAEQGVSIGRPITNTDVHVVATSGRLAAIGAEGELSIGGRGLARGYLRRPALTAERFVPDPFCPSGGGRLYRTGDRVRRRPDGRLDHLGRLDHQVKILGHRIEPGEIESVLRRHPGVREAAVLQREDAAGPRLLAYLVGAGKEPEPRVDAAAKEQLLAGRQRFRLPNGMEIAQFDARQAMELYHEVFEDTAYDRHGVRFRDGDCIFDVGANTGFFTLFACQQCTPSRVFAFEPMPPNYELLQINTALYGDGVKTFRCGLAAEPGAAQFTFFPNITGLSSRFADAEEERRAVASIAQSFESKGAFEALGQDELQSALDEHLRTETYDCELRTLSQAIREEGVERIDLLKIDVERSEVEVLEGIDDDDWPKIRQIVLEVHSDELLAATRAILEGRGFEVAVDDFLHFDGQDGSGLRIYLVYALRPEAAAERGVTEVAAPGLPDAAALRGWLSEQLPAYMVPAAFVELSTLPRTPNGKLDRAALPEPGASSRSAATAYVEPQGETERLVAEVWREVLGLEKVGAKDNFFEAGGTSLSLVQVSRSLEKSTGRPVPLVEMFRHPTVGAMAEFLVSTNGDGVATVVEEGKVRAERRAEALRGSSELERQRRFMANRPRRGRRRGGRPDVLAGP